MKEYFSLTKTGPKFGPKKICLIGQEGVGKTSAGTEMENPFFICSESGLNDSHIDIKHYTPEDWLDLKNLIIYLTNKEHDYKTLVIDTVDWLEPLIEEFVCKRDGKKNLFDYGYGKGEGIAAEEFRAGLALIEALQAKKNMWVLLNVHCTIRNHNNPIGDDYDRFELAISKKKSELIRQWCDAVLFARFDNTTYKKTGSSRAKGQGGSKRVVQTTHSFAWDAKNRCGLPEEMPFDIKLIVEAIKKGENTGKESLIKNIRELASLLPIDKQEKINSYVSEKLNIQALKIALNKVKVMVDEQNKEQEAEETQVV